MHRLTHLTRVGRSVVTPRSTGLALPRRHVLLRYNSSTSGVPPSSSSSSKPPPPPEDASLSSANVKVDAVKTETSKVAVEVEVKETLSSEGSTSGSVSQAKPADGERASSETSSTPVKPTLQAKATVEVNETTLLARSSPASSSPNAASTSERGLDTKNDLLRSTQTQSKASSPSSLQASSQSKSAVAEEEEEWSVLMRPDELYDSYETHEIPATPFIPARKGQPAVAARPFRTRVNLINNPSLYPVESDDPEQRSSGAGVLDKEDLDGDAAEKETRKQFNPLKHLPLTQKEIQKLHRFLLIRKRVVQMTGKGKMDSMYVLVVMGNGQGLVGYGEGKASEMSDAILKAQVEAVKNLDYVDRFEARTLWSDLDSKLGATRVLMRPRPVGFGLRCNPYLHQVLKAAGVKDVSAKVWGSRNGMNIIKASMRALHGGNAVLGMGDGVGGPSRRLESKVGMRGRDALERERGRKLIDARLW